MYKPPIRKSNDIPLWCDLFTILVVYFFSVCSFLVIRIYFMYVWWAFLVRPSSYKLCNKIYFTQSARNKIQMNKRIRLVSICHCLVGQTHVFWSLLLKRLCFYLPLFLISLYIFHCFLFPCSSASSFRFVMF